MVIETTSSTKQQLNTRNGHCEKEKINHPQQTDKLIRTEDGN